MTLSRLTRGALAVTVAALVIVAPAAAGAQTSDTRPGDRPRETSRPARSDGDMEAAKERAKQAIDVRITAIDTTIARLRAAELVTAEHRDHLVRDLEAVSSSLASLRRQIEAEQDPARLKALMQQIVTEHYVFAFQIPRARLVAGADVAVGIALKLQGVADRLEVKILEAEERGHDMSEARRHLDALRADARTARGLGARIAPEVLELTVDGYPDNKPTLKRSRQGLQEAKDRLRAAHGHARAIVAELRQAGRS